MSTDMTLIYPRESNNTYAPRLSPAYKSTVKRSPTKPLVIIPHTLSELTGPVYGNETVRENDHDLTIQHQSEPLGERIIVHGHVRDKDGRGVPNTLLEVWPANACGRYIHVVDQLRRRSIRTSPGPAARRPTTTVTTGS
jgi:protocatechuate 3,4-dioxygenase beta subunit